MELTWTAEQASFLVLAIVGNFAINLYVIDRALARGIGFRQYCKETKVSGILLWSFFGWLLLVVLSVCLWAVERVMIGPDDSPYAGEEAVEPQDGAPK